MARSSDVPPVRIQLVCSLQLLIVYLDRSHVEVVLRIRRYFEEEKQQGKRRNANQVVNRLSEANGIRKSLRSRIRSEEDVTNRPIASGEICF